MQRDELQKYCEALVNAELFIPPRFSHVTIYRHASHGKWFALLVKLHGKECINVKNKPDYNNFLRMTFAGVKAAWHMNKEHWITVELDSDVPAELLEKLVYESYQLTL